jgi:amino acid adenylation domain-containing protein
MPEPSLTTLPALLVASARRRPSHVAIEEPPDRAVTYGALDALSDRVRDRLAALGVARGDRVGVYLTKSIDAVAAIFGAMKAGAAYVPVDPAAPAWRAAYILSDCSVKVVLVERRLAGPFAAEVTKLGASVPALIELDGTGGGAPLAAALDRGDAARPAPGAASPAVGPDDLAYILYTSGSTGKPKGVMLTHGNALGFVDWCSGVFRPGDADRFSSHAPFHFDLSILDLYVPLKHGATLVLIGSEAGREPVGLGALIAERRITVWYSAPSILSMLAQYGKLDRNDYAALRTVIFAGEVFPVKHLRALKALWPAPRYFNLYGPTETNVCTYYEVPPTIPADRTEPYPIGKVCENLRARVVDEQGRDVPAGAEGELVIAGSNVMQGYWNLAERTAKAFLVDPRGGRWYRTGDIVVADAAGDWLFVGRRDRMVKRRGNRVELGEIEAGLYRHPAVKEAAVIARPDEESGVRITAFLVCREGAAPTVIELKKFCAENLPAAFIPDVFAVRGTLPKTSTDKIDYQRLMETV